MRWTLAALILAAPLFADEGEKKKTEAIPATPIVAPEAVAPVDAAAEIKQLTEEYNKATQEFFQPYRDAQAKGETYKLDYSKHPQKIYAAKFTELAKKFAGQDAAIDAWVMVLRCGGDRDAVIEAVMRDHIQSKGMINVVGSMAWMPNGDALLLKIVEENPNRDVQGFALLIRGEALLRNGNDSAESVLLEVVANYGDVAIYGGRMTAGAKATGDLFEARNLTVGKQAPDIEGEDIEGVAFKLSDYRGKVILLDFWGDW